MTERMVLDDIIRVVAEQGNLTQGDARMIVCLVFNTIIDAVSMNWVVSISGFGKFHANHSAAYQARNPKTGKPVKVPAKYRPKFNAYTAFKEAVNEPKKKKKV